jgi:hypothetical protein
MSIDNCRNISFVIFAIFKLCQRAPSHSRLDDENMIMHSFLRQAEKLQKTVMYVRQKNVTQIFSISMVMTHCFQQITVGLSQPYQR